MARKRYEIDEARIKRFQREKRGLGSGKDYKSWLLVSDVPSKGRCHRMDCPLTKRELQLMTDNEFFSFLNYWWDDNVIDIKEQYPLDRRETFEIAALCGIKHPTDQHTGTLLVISTDLLVTYRVGDEIITIAIAVKEATDLENKRILEKLEIERQYWNRRGVTWRITTNVQVKDNFSKNLAWMLGFYKGSPQDERTHKIDDVVLSKIITAKIEMPHAPVKLVCKFIDRELGFKLGTSLAGLRRLLAVKALTVDLTLKCIQDAPVEAFQSRRFNL